LNIVMAWPLTSSVLMGELWQSEIPIPDGLCCSITKEIMQDPVCTCDGHSYERAQIEIWLRQSLISPLTGLHLASLIVTPNVNLRKAISALRAASPAAGPGVCGAVAGAGFDR
jgi:hypothetical protein